MVLEIERYINETELDFHRRIVDGKAAGGEFYDVDYSELSVPLYGRQLSNDTTRKMMAGSRETLALVDASVMGAATQAGINEQFERLSIEKQKFYDERRAYNKLLRERARQEELNEIITRSIEKGNLPKLNYEPSHVSASDRDMIVSLNDIHYGLCVDNAWAKYNPEICVEMFNNYLDRIIDINKANGCETCYVTMNGDAISGRIHQTIEVSNRENVVWQAKGVSEIIAGFLAVLSKYFKRVVYVSVAGNHSRLTSKENSPKDERLDDIIEWYLEARLKDFCNIEIITDKLDTSMYVLDIRGKKYLGVHGDYDSSPSGISSLLSMVDGVYCVLLGHLHHNKFDTVMGVRTVMAGSFVGVDDYCVQKRIMGRQEQLVCICDSSGILCYYDIPLSVV